MSIYDFPTWNIHALYVRRRHPHLSGEIAYVSRLLSEHPSILDLWLSLFAKRALGSILSLCRSRKYGTRVAHNPTWCQFMNRMKKSVTSMCIPAILIVLGTTAPLAAAPSGRVAIMNAHSGLCL